MIVRRLTQNWDMGFGQGLANFASDAEAVAQDVKTRLQLLRGEWFLDVEDGVPYLQQICTKPANFPLAESVIKQRIITTEGVAEVTEFSMTYDSETRRLSISAKVRTQFNNFADIRVSLA